MRGAADTKLLRLVETPLLGDAVALGLEPLATTGLGVAFGVVVVASMLFLVISSRAPPLAGNEEL